MLCMTEKRRLTKKIPRELSEHFAREVKAYVDTHHEGNGTKAAESLGLSQPHLSQLMSATADRGPGLSALLLFRKVMNRSVDSLLGLPPLSGEVASSESVDAMVRAAIEREMARRAQDVSRAAINSGTVQTPKKRRSRAAQASRPKLRRIK